MNDYKDLPEKSIYYPEWIILKIHKDTTVKPLYKVFLTSPVEGWRLNSGIINYKIKEGFVYFYGYSGSIYKCSLDGEDNINFYYQSILDNFLSLEFITKISLEDFKKEFAVNKE